MGKRWKERQSRVGLHAAQHCLAQNKKHRVTKPENSRVSLCTPSCPLMIMQPPAYGHMLAASLQGQHMPAKALEYPVLSVIVLLNRHQLISTLAEVFFNSELKLSMYGRCKENEVKNHWEIRLLAAEGDNDRRAEQTPQVSPGNGLLTKPYYTVRLLPM